MTVFYAALPENKTDRNSARIDWVNGFDKNGTQLCLVVFDCVHSRSLRSGASLYTVSARLSRPSWMAAVRGMMG